MSDLQCPATVLLVPNEALADVAALRDRHLSGVFVVPSIAIETLASRSPETLHDAVDLASLRDAIDHLADLHRGETIAVVATAEQIRGLLGTARAPSAPIAISIDSSGWAPAIDET